MKTLDQGFREFGLQLTTPERESAAAKSHRASIKDCLEENFGLQEFFQSGSFGNGTNVPVHSDVDRFAVIPQENLPVNASAALRKVSIALRRRFRTTLGIRVQRPAVVVPFGVDGLETTEIIPAFFVGTHDGEKVYKIPSPDGGSEWIFSAPKGLRNYINEIDATYDNKLKPLVRFVKSWKYHRKVPIQSVYLELTCAAVANLIGLSTPSIDIARVLHLLRTNKLAAVHSPLGIGDPVMGPNTRGQREDALSKASGGARIATRAVTAELEWRIKPAFIVWKQLFGQRFPKPE